MHYHLEIIMPPTDDVEAAVDTVMAPFDENGGGSKYPKYPFWDWWQIGGRYLGKKVQGRSYSGKSSTYDVCTLSEMPEGLTAFHVIIAAPGDEGRLEVEHMVMRRIWNGVYNQEPSWDGNVLAVVRAFLERIEGYSPEYRAKITPRPDWLVVTVDYHS